MRTFWVPMSSLYIENVGDIHVEGTTHPARINVAGKIANSVAPRNTLRSSRGHIPSSPRPDTQNASLPVRVAQRRITLPVQPVESPREGVGVAQLLCFEKQNKILTSICLHCVVLTKNKWEQRITYYYPV